MKREWILFTVAALIMAITVFVTFAECSKNSLNIAEYKATPKEFEHQLDESIAFTSLSNAPVNNSRGFRGETYITLGRKEAYPGSGEVYMEKLENELKILENDDIRLMQVYVYLIEYYNTDIPQSAFDYLKYHLGYQLVALNLKIENGKVSFMITNYGFASSYGYEMRVYIDGKRVMPDKDYVYTDLLQFSQIVYTCSYTGGNIGIEFVNLRDEKDKIRLFNDVPFIDGKNIIYRPNVK